MVQTLKGELQEVNMIIQCSRDNDRKSVTYTAELRASFEIMDEMQDVITEDMICETLYRVLKDALEKEKNNKECKFVIVDSEIKNGSYGGIICSFAEKYPLN